MKTADFIDLLARGDAQIIGVNAKSHARRMAWAPLAAVLLSVVFTALWLGLRRDWGIATAPMFWAKLAFPALMFTGAVLAFVRLARPGATVGRAWWWSAVAVLAMWTLAAVVLVTAQPDDYRALLLGVSWKVCPFYIALIATPALAVLVWAMRKAAPTRPALAGAAAGLAAGAAGALAYALYCPEMAAPFIGIWYLAGMLIPALAGALAGRWLFRW